MARLHVCGFLLSSVWMLILLADANVVRSLNADWNIIQTRCTVYSIDRNWYMSSLSTLERHCTFNHLDPCMYLRLKGIFHGFLHYIDTDGTSTSAFLFRKITYPDWLLYCGLALVNLCCSSLGQIALNLDARLFIFGECLNAYAKSLFFYFLRTALGTVLLTTTSLLLDVEICQAAGLRGVLDAKL